MESVLSLKMLGVLALVLLASGTNEGRVLSKCELKAQLDAALGANVTGNLTQDRPANLTRNLTESMPTNMTTNMTGDLIAKLICALERTSRFNTSLITTFQLPPPPQRPQRPDRPHHKPVDSHGGRPGGKPGNSHGGRPGGKSEDSHERHPGKKPGASNGGRPGGKQRGKRSSHWGPEEGQNRPTVGTIVNLYGIFQLNDRVACHSGSNLSQNICRMNCTALIDDDIRDDIVCLKTLMGHMSNEMNVMFVEECRSVVPSQYFAGCV